MSSIRTVAAAFKDANETSIDSDTECFSIRYLIILIVCIGGLLSSALIICIQPKIVSWKKVNFNECIRSANKTDELLDLKWRTEEKLKATIHLWAQLLMSIPSVWISQRFGGKYILEYSVCITGLLTLLIPTSVEVGYINFLILRFIIGLVLTLATPSLINIAINWIPKDEKNYLITLLTLGDTCSYIFIPPIATHFSLKGNDKSWPLFFYMIGILSVMWSILCMSTVTESSSKHRWPSKSEREILQLKSLSENCRKKHIPWIELVKSKPFWALLSVSFTSSISHFVVQITMPSLLSQILEISISDIVNIMIIPFIFQLIISIICSLIADWALLKRRITTTKTRKLAVLISQTILVCCFLILATVKCHSWFSILLLNLIIIVTGINKIGTDINFIDLAPLYAGSIFAFCNSAKIAGHLITTYIVLEHFQPSMFYIAASSSVISTLGYLVFGSGGKQTWANV